VNSAKAPNLVLQMQRMGDLILSFPLLARLRREEPDRPLRVVAEERFFTSLMPFAPDAVFFPPEAAERLASTRYRRVINLSHRREAALLCARLKAEEHLGRLQTSERASISGYWQLYRASLVRNNRHNRFHWADLHMMDLFAPSDTRRARPAEPAGAGQGRVGLFVGASEEEKRPAARFWGELAAALTRKGMKTVLLGGPKDRPFAKEAARRAGMPGINLCGRFDLRAFAEFIQKLDLFVTPDTGPMHLAVWLGVPVLNLSLGPVHALETGPAASGHHVLRCSFSCSGCWTCTRGGQACRAAFTPERTALVTHTLLRDPKRLPGLRMPGLSLCLTERTREGLFNLRALTPEAENARDCLGRFWQAWFLEHAPRVHAARSREAARELAGRFPRLLPSLRRAAAQSMRRCAATLRTPGRALPPSFWESAPPLIRPFTGRLQLFLQNEDYAKKAWEEGLAELEELLDIFS
jgi:ADP-heptose:LPS heptosyltransferase